MRAGHLRNRAVLLAAALGTSAALIAGCTPAGPSATGDFTFAATRVTAQRQTEMYAPQGCSYLFANCYDEPYLVNIAFRVTYDLADSADAWVVSTRGTSPEPTLCIKASQPPCPSGSETEALQSGSGKNGGQVKFTGVRKPTLTDFTNPENKLEVLGVWTWGMEEDWVGTPLPGVIAPVIERMLNETIALAQPPEEPEDTVQDIIDRFTEAIELGGSSLADAITDALAGIGDDLLGSRLYLFVGSSGGLASAIDLASFTYDELNLELESFGIPDIAEVFVKSTSSQSFAAQSFASDKADHRYDISAG